MSHDIADPRFGQGLVDGFSGFEWHFLGSVGGTPRCLNGSEELRMALLTCMGPWKFGLNWAPFPPHVISDCLHTISPAQ